MPRIRTVPPEAATGQLADAYERLRETMGSPFAPLVIQLSGIRPDITSSLASLYQALFGGGELSRKTKEAIATYVAALNDCPYCVGAHTTLMSLHGASPEQVEAARIGDVAAFTDDEETARFLPLAEKITRHAYKVTDGDIQALRDSGWSDEKILEAVGVVVFFNLINRLADTFGIAEDDFQAELARALDLLAG
ncbi:MAG: peroxidase-related enzyme [Actinomycetota bacterium]|nr:peroxidase-related enzyme [Actinomycetota bacterium]